jgi:hypothetical protein
MGTISTLADSTSASASSARRANSASQVERGSMTRLRCLDGSLGNLERATAVGHLRPIVPETVPNRTDAFRLWLARAHLTTPVLRDARPEGRTGSHVARYSRDLFDVLPSSFAHLGYEMR